MLLTLSPLTKPEATHINDQRRGPRLNHILFVFLSRPFIRKKAINQNIIFHFSSLIQTVLILVLLLSSKVIEYVFNNYISFYKEKKYVFSYRQ